MFLWVTYQTGLSHRFLLRSVVYRNTLIMLKAFSGRRGLSIWEQWWLNTDTWMDEIDSLAT